MTHRFPLKEIAQQSGLSTATIDRAINDRSNVSPQTKARVERAISELEGQEIQLAARGRRMFFDFVIEAPDRFSREVRQAAEQVLPKIGTAVCRPRFVLQPKMSETEVLLTLARILKRGSQGVCLKVRDLSSIQAAVDRLTKVGIPVVTLVTDLTGTNRIAYVGLDNKSAGRTAAYLIAKSLRTTDGTVLTSRSNDLFLGEEEREAEFIKTLHHHAPNLRIVDVTGGQGVHHETARLMDKAVGHLGYLCAVYSMGGGNITILDVLEENKIKPDIYIAHDLDKDNRALIEARRISFVLHHDLRIDLENVFQAFLHHHKLVTGILLTPISNIQVVTPENIPLGPHD
ncbi:LacI family DNA-binding transcriptional regulator [Ascidiaceihabitans sp.]|nr:LacI family DNA-binding transcriptional regulator [Ascidiaceihabitans sp.]